MKYRIFTRSRCVPLFWRPITGIWEHFIEEFPNFDFRALFYTTKSVRLQSDFCGLVCLFLRLGAQSFWQQVCIRENEFVYALLNAKMKIFWLAKCFKEYLHQEQSHKNHHEDEHHTTNGVVLVRTFCNCRRPPSECLGGHKHELSYQVH